MLDALLRELTSGAFPNLRLITVAGFSGLTVNSPLAGLGTSGSHLYIAPDQDLDMTSGHVRTAHLFLYNNGSVDNATGFDLRLAPEYTAADSVGLQTTHEIPLVLNGPLAFNAVVTSPTCDSAHRGYEYYVRGVTGLDGGTRDTKQVCFKNGDNTFSLVVVAGGTP